MSFFSLHRNRVLLFASFLQAAVVVYAVHFVDFRGSVPHFRTASGGGMLLDTKPEFSVEGVYRRLESFGEDGRAVYSFRLFTVDLLLPVSILLFLFPAVSSAAARLKNPRIRLAFLFLPWVFFVFDVAENSTIYLLLDSFPDRRPLAAGILSFLSALKRIGMIGSVLAALGLSLANVRQKSASNP